MGTRYEKAAPNGEIVNLLSFAQQMIWYVEWITICLYMLTKNDGAPTLSSLLS